ncbi:hypothetical protein BOTBODRAFT_40001, partial [Botryobasidium botryosum FD-172 SS1]
MEDDGVVDYRMNIRVIHQPIEPNVSGLWVATFLVHSFRGYRVRGYVKYMVERGSAEKWTLTSTRLTDSARPSRLRLEGYKQMQSRKVELEETQCEMAWDRGY